MSKKIAVAVIHGVGKQDRNFARPIKEELVEFFADELGISEDDAKNRLVIKPIYWADKIQGSENKLWKKVNAGADSAGSDLDFRKLRRFMIDFAGDGIAYQPSPSDRYTYNEVHIEFAKTLKSLADEAGNDSPLCIIAHSLGTVIASNYLYDLQKQNDLKKPIKIAEAIKDHIGNTPLEQGNTFTLFYTLGCPIAIWSLRYKDFGDPISVPSDNLNNHYPNLKRSDSEWVNFYDDDDIIAYPIKKLNDKYKKQVTKDIAINVGGFFSSWNPTCHTEYWTDNDVTKPIAKKLAALWKAVNS